MKITLLVVGKTADKHLDALIGDYCGRLTHYAPFVLRVIPELSGKGKVSQDVQKKQEGELILKAVSSSAALILLDERGEQFRSMEFANYLQKQMSSGRDIVFVVGGPFGFSKEVYDRSNGMISLSKMTFSHQMVRLFFVEQLYRACTILRGESYHHE